MSKEKEVKNIFPIENSDYYQFYLLEREQINKLKDFLEKQSFQSVDYSYAEWLWIMNYRNAWKDSLKTGSFKSDV
jgi:hypothetical protein